MNIIHILLFCILAAGGMYSVGCDSSSENGSSSDSSLDDSENGSEESDGDNNTDDGDDTGNDPVEQPPPPVEASDPLFDLGTDFTSFDSSQWQIHNPANATIESTGDRLRITPTQTMLWYNNTATGVLVARQVTGDFVMTAFVRTRRQSDTGLPPAPNVKLAGLMVRDPSTASGHNYAFIVLGHDEDDLSVEVKTTVDSVSTYDGPVWPDGQGQLRICRIGNTYRFYIRADTDDDWDLQTPPEDGPFPDPGHAGWSGFNSGVLTRNDLPATVEAGINVYSLSDTDLQVEVDYLSFQTPVNAADCTL